MQDVKQGIYQHFKGNIYHVYGIAENTETGEFTVMYSPQYGDWAGKLCNRNAVMFLEEVDRPSYKGPRFKLLEEKKFL